MKNHSRRKSIHRKASFILVTSVAALVSYRSARGANAAWDGSSVLDGLWSTIENWVGDPTPPGDTSGTTNTDIATFNAAIANTWGNSAANPIVIDPNRNIGGINFDLAAGNYFIGATGANALKVSSGGAIQILNTLTASNALHTINAPLRIQSPSGTYTLANNSANGSGAGAGTLRVGGGITGGAAGATVLTLDGSNTNANTVSGVIANGSATGLSVTKNGTGTWFLSGANTFTGPVQVNGGTLNVFHDSNLGAAGTPVTLTGGTLQTTSTYSSHGLAISTASTIHVGGDFLFSITTLQNGALTGSGTLTKTGGGTFFLAAGSGNTFSGDITLAFAGGTFQVGSSVSSNPAGGATLPALTSANTITVNRGATFRIEDNATGSAAGYIADRFGSAGNRPAVILNGGTFNLNGATTAAVMTQTLGTLTLAAGASTINVTRNNGTPELVFSSLSRSFGAYVNFTTNANLGTGTSDARILFSAPALTGGGGAAGSPTISILLGARSGNDLVTYGANGIRPLVAAEYNAVALNDINGAGPTENVKISQSSPTAFAALTAPRTINALVNTAAGSATWAMGNTLTLTSGQFIQVGSGGVTISSGILTAGTGAVGTVELDLSTVGGTITLGANVNDNGPTKVALVKNGITLISLNNNTTDNTYSGGTFVNEGSVFTGTTANRRYLGSGPVMVNGGGRVGLGTTLSLGAIGATSFSGSKLAPTYTVRTSGMLRATGGAPSATEFFKVETGAVLAVSPTSGAGFDLDINLDAAPGAILGETAAGGVFAIKKGGIPIQTALTNPTYYFGIAGNLIQDNITVGAGTPWVGIARDTSYGLGASYGGSSSTITANSDFSFVGGAGSGGQLNLGDSANIVRIATPNGNVNVSLEGYIYLNNAASQFGSAGNKVTFQVTSGATLVAGTATAMGVAGGAATGPASIVVQNGGVLSGYTFGAAPDAFNGNVTILPGGMFTQNQATLTGTGTFTHSNGSILNLITSTAAVSGATQALGTVPGTIVRLGVNGLLVGTSTGGVTQLDSGLDDAAIYELTGLVNFGNATAVTDSLLTLSASGGIGGVLTNASNTVTLNTPGATGVIAIGPGGGTFAATTGTIFYIGENFALGANTLTIGSAQSYDGNPKLGLVHLQSTSGTNTGSAGSVIAVLNGATLRIGGGGGQIPDATRLSLNSGGTVDLNGNSETVESLTGAGTVTSLFSSILNLLSTTTDANFSGNLGSNLSLTKTGTGTQTLSGANGSYTGATAVSQGTLLVSGSISGSTTTVSNAGSTLGGTGTVGNVTVNSGAILQGGDGVTTPSALTSAGDVSLLDGSVIKLTLGLGLTHSSLARTGGNWTFDNDQKFTFSITPGATAGFYDNIITGVTAAQVATFGTWTIDAATGVTGTFSYDGANVDLNVTVIPEPGTAALLLAGLPLLGLRRWRRRG